MPIFEYACQNCGKVAEFLEASDTKDVHVCPECGGKNMAKLLSVFAGRVKESRSASPSCATCTDGSCPLR